MIRKKYNITIIVAAVLAVCFCAFTLTACLEQEDKEITTAVFESAEYDYDGNEHKIEVAGIPNGVSVVYENNEATEPGVYDAKATLSGDGYKTLVLTATLTINEVTFVSDYDELCAALEKGGRIALSADIELNGDDRIEITKATLLNGCGHTVTASEFQAVDYRIVNVAASNCTVEIKNISFVATKSTGYMRGINVGVSENLKIYLNNVNVSLPDYYALNIVRLNKNLEINAENVSLSGWSAVNNHSYGVKFNAVNSTFTGTNIHESKGSTSNHYTTIVASNYVLYNDGDTFIEECLCANNTFEFENCRIISRVGETDGAAIDTMQYLIDLRSPFNNKLYLSNCELSHCAGDDGRIHSAYDSAYIPDENRDDADFKIDTNKIFIDGIDVTSDETRVIKYLDE